MNFFARMRVRKEIIMSNIDEHSTNEELVEFVFSITQK